MSNESLFLPPDYRPVLDIMETQEAIKLIKDTFERELARMLGLTRVSAPLFVLPSSGLNDNLSGVERPVQFDILEMGEDVQIVQSLAKWKRMVLHRYGVEKGRGLYTDMNAIRRDETLDNIHSVYVDQWDWELVIGEKDRTLEFLKKLVTDIIAALARTEAALCKKFLKVERFLHKDVTFITTQELADRYPNLDGHGRERAIAKECGTVFIMQIGSRLRDGTAHDSRAPDYDDWSLNGDILVWNPILNQALEISSMGIRVDSAALDHQLTVSGCDDRRELDFHRMLLKDELPLTAGGGIGQSRLCMLLLQKAHIGEVQASVWPKDMMELCGRHGIHML